MFSSFISKLRIYRFFDDFVIIYPLYTLMFENSGLNLSQISVLLLVWSSTSFILEIPSGVFADKYDRKAILILAQLSRVLGFLCWVLFPTFFGYLAGFLLWGIKSAFTSGTLDAYLYDGLKEENKESSYSKILGELKSLSFVAILLASALASVLFFLGYKLILSLSIFSLLISIFALLTAKSTKIIKSTEEVKYFLILKDGLQDVYKNSKLLLFVLVSSILVGAMAIDEYFALYVDSVHFPKMFVGYLFAFYSLLQAIGSFYAHKLNSRNVLLLILGVFGLTIFSIGFSSGIIGIVLFMLLALISSVGQVISNTAIQQTAKGHVRATVGSVAGFLSEILAFSVYVVFWLVPSGEIKSGLILYGGLVILLSLAVISFSFIKKV